jgi:hypothetical protein
MADFRIGQKNEIAIVREARRALALKRDIAVALLPDCLAPLHARN